MELDLLQQIVLWVVYLACFRVSDTNSKTSSTLWRLSADETKIVEAAPFRAFGGGTTAEDPIFTIIASTILNGRERSSWVKSDREIFCSTCPTIRGNVPYRVVLNNESYIEMQNEFFQSVKDDDVLDCGKPVNFTYYDSLVGVSNRHRHPNVPEPQIALILGSKIKRGKEQSIEALERRLRKAKKEKPKSVQLYNQIGNFWRIKGDAEKAIECFRRALAVSPHNSEVLLNLARVLFTLQYLDDAIYLTRRSLETQTPERGAWQQYFTLGEIFKAYGHYQEATLHLKHVLQLKPGFEPAQVALQEMDTLPAAKLHFYTMFIIFSLALGCILVILSSTDSGADEEIGDIRPQRHFNRAMAMSTLRGFRHGAHRCQKLSP